MKRNVLLAFVLATFLLSACGKSDSPCVPATVASEKAAMVAFCTANGITYTEHPSGILYEIVAPGLTTQPNLTNTVSVVYTGKLLNGTVFDASANPVRLALNAVIQGWQIGIPLIKKGGRIKLVIPSSLSYGCTGQGSISPNSPLYFEVSLTDVL
jgi:FKBP-type peptidyl-prolyl cis-trans isomerase